MTVVGLHPEELFDKLADGELTPVERDRLRAHLDGCEVCRFEYAARLDFQAEALTLAAESPLLLPLLPLRAAPPAPAPRRRSRTLIWGLAAAALITASGAVASVVTGKVPWQASLLFSSKATRVGQPAERMSFKAAHGRGTAAAPDVAAGQEPASEVKSSPEQLAPVLVGLPAAREQHAASVAAGHKLARGGAARSGPVVAAALPVEPAAKESAAKESAAKEPALKEPTPAAKLFAEANQARRAGDIGRASGLYHVLQDQFPGSAEAELSRVTLALLLLDSGDAQNALSGFERYLAGPSRGLEAEALVGRARALGRLGRRDLEAVAWQEVQRKYPRSIYGRQASERLSALGLP